MLFRVGVTDWLRNRHVSKTRIRKLKKGKRNYWWYETLHREIGLGAIYEINKVFTILYMSTVLLILSAGAVRLLAVLAALLYALSSVLLVAMSVFASVQSNKQQYGKAFIWLRRRSNRGFDSSVIDITAALFVLVFAVVYFGTVFGYVNAI